MPSPSPATAVYTGSFDPITLGHRNVIERSCQMFTRVVVGIGTNSEKSSFFTMEERVALVRACVADFHNVEVSAFDGLAVDFVRQCDSRVMIRGVRPLTDIAGEFTMLMANRQLDAEIETIFLMADEEFAHVSSSLIKQIAPLSDDSKLARFVPAPVIPALRQKLEQQQSQSLAID